MRKTLSLIFILTLALAFTQTSDNNNNDIVNEYLGLSAYPGSTIISQEDDDRESETVFESEDDIDTIYEFFHDELTEMGWERTELEREDDEIEAEYEKDDESFEFELEYEGDNRYELEIDF